MRVCVRVYVRVYVCVSAPIQRTFSPKSMNAALTTSCALLTAAEVMSGAKVRRPALTASPLHD